MNDKLLEIKNLSKRFIFYKNPIKKSYIEVLKDISFSIKEKEILALVGESGSGKSTVGKIILRMEKPTQGYVKFQGKDIYTYGKNYTKLVSAVFQDPSSSLNPYMKVKEIVEEPLIVHKVKERKEKIEKALELVKLSKELMNRKPNQLSGGQRQRVAIARAVVLEPKLIVADEPTSSLDASVRLGILELFLTLRNTGISILFITHDIRSVERIADKVVVLYKGRIMEFGEKNSVITSPKHPYTKYLLENVPVRHPSQRHPVQVEHEEEFPQTECPFYHICPYRMDHCREYVREVHVNGSFVRCNLY